MKPIRAFIGHSFAKHDAALVGQFSQYFDQLAGMHPTFSWQHAEPAEPKDLADKVLNLISEKNLFIGICTKQERAVGSSNLRTTRFPSGHLKARESDFSWKTSDWVIQEIGLAIGRGLDLMLLIEEGLRKPGGLQGNIEYISFPREAPEKSFGKIVEMLTALTPRLDLSTTESEQKASTSAEEVHAVDAEQKSDEWAAPQPSWGRRDYEIAYFHYVMMGDSSGASEISDAYLATESGKLSPDGESWEAHCEYAQLRFGKGGSLLRLKDLAEQHPENGGVIENLARSYALYKQFSAAATNYEKAAKVSNETPTRLRCLRASARNHQEAGDVSATSAIIEEMKRIVNESEQGERELLLAERKHAEDENLDEVLVGVLERLLEIDPSDNETRFSLAYKYSDLGQKNLALLHYGSIPPGDRRGGNWNNLGVAYDELDLPVKAVEAYRQAEVEGETLAMSNLANKFISSGFLSEAKKITDSALAASDFHKNVATTATRLKEVSGEEVEKEKEVLDKARETSAFNCRFGAAVSKIAPNTIDDSWQGLQCKLSVTWEKGAFYGIGNYEQLSLGALMLPLANTRKEQYVVEYRAVVHGRALVGTVARRRGGQQSEAAKSLLNSAEESKVLMVLSDDGSEMQVLEQSKAGIAQHYSLQSLPPE